MIGLSIFLSIALLFSLILNYLKLSSQKTAFEIVNDMGIGYNLGNSFDCYYAQKKVEKPDDQITLNGNPIPTKDLIIRIKKYGFKTIRFPITWINFIDEKGNINSEWLNRVKEVVTWIINANMYCIINVYSDGEYYNWLYYGIESREKYINLWSQIANEFKDYDEHLIFESMNFPQYFNIYFEYDYKTLLNLSQAFVDTIRNSENMNKQRLLIISGAYADLELSCNKNFKLPEDPMNKIAISFHYFNPYNFVLENYFEPWNISDDSGYVTMFMPDLTWGTDNDYNELFTDINIIKSYFLDKNIPVIITAAGVLTEEKKDIRSIREYLYVLFSISVEYKGMMICLWDTSKNIEYTNSYTSYTMNYYNRKEDKWLDEKIKNNFLVISKGRYIKLSEYYVYTNKEILISANNLDNYRLKFGDKKPLKIILNAKLKGKLFQDISFSFRCYDNTTRYIDIDFGKKNLKREYDGTSTFTIDVSEKGCISLIEVNKEFGKNENIIFNNLTVIFNNTFLSFDYKSYKTALEKFIN